ncbi:hypothetical protein [Psychrobacillus soli]|uniref:DUF881 domain-containing protein n=1 Tax=Psychrobacillus soli TaxID=1543965 RepID=A0A544TDT8_9BACI|nr:hypothetical protein [Psychrobacillus soli]TQR15628.1 hypothetical protein FG383_08565 [Psychrobacillus soli]
MQKKGILLLAILSMIVFLAACIDKSSVDNSIEMDEKDATKQLIEDKDTQIKKLEEKNEELQDSLHSIQTDLNYTKEEANYYNQLIDELLNDYSDAQLLELAKKLWNYELEVNGSPVPRDGIIEIQENTIEISLIETQPAYVVLPDDIFIQGKVSGNYYDHLKFNANPSETYGTDGTVVTGVHHKFVDVEKGATISFSITEELKKSLGLDTAEIMIKSR